MAHLARLILLAWLLLPAWSWGYGQVPKKPAVVYTCAGGTGPSGPAACADGAAKAPKTCPVSWPGDVCEQITTVLSCDSKSCTMQQEQWLTSNYWHEPRTRTGLSQNIHAWDSYPDGYICPEFSTGVGAGAGASCECREGYKPEGSSCVPVYCYPAGSYTAITQPDQQVNNAGDGICMGGCGYTPSHWKAGQDGRIWAGWPFKSTGKPCQGAPDPGTGVKTGEENTSKPAPVPCGQNQCPGTAGINGNTVQMCVACKGSSAAPVTETASAPAGSASGATGIGDTTKTTQTECDGNTCTTTTTTKDGTGAVTGSSTKQEPQENFCQANPASPLCKKSSFGGSCAATACDGDAVQCALTQEVIKRNCQLFDDAGVTKPLQAVGEKAVADGLKPSDHPGSEGNVTKVDASASGRISQEDSLPGACPADQSFAVASYNLVVPFSRVCEPAAILGKAMVALSMLVAALIIFKG